LSPPAPGPPPPPCTTLFRSFLPTCPAEKALASLSLSLIVSHHTAFYEWVTILISLPPIVDSFLFQSSLVLPETVFLQIVTQFPSKRIESFFNLNESLQRCEQAHRNTVTKVTPLSNRSEERRVGKERKSG